MKADTSVRMVSAETPVVIARACHLFINDLTKRALFESEENNRKTLAKEDVYAAIAKCDAFDFLVDVCNGVVEEEFQSLKRSRASSNSIVENNDDNHHPSLLKRSKITHQEEEEEHEEEQQ